MTGETRHMAYVIYLFVQVIIQPDYITCDRRTCGIHLLQEILNKKIIHHMKDDRLIIL